MRGKPEILKLKVKQDASTVWKGMSKAAFILEKGCRRVVRNGYTTRFWLDVWCGVSPLRDEAKRTIPNHMIHAKVADYWDSNMGWDWTTLKPFLTDKACNNLGTKKLSEDDSITDGICWGYEESSRFTIKFAYSLFTNQNCTLKDNDWTRIWNLKVPNRICTFIWIVKQSRILTNVERHRRKLIENEICGVCGEGREDIDHVLRKCPKATQIWKKVLKGNFVAEVSSQWEE